MATRSLRALSVAMRRALVPAIILLAVNIVVTQVTRPVGPFNHDGSDEDLIGIAYNFTAALLFQIVLLVFLGVIAALVYVKAGHSNGLPESVVLGPALALLYASIVVSAIMLAIRPPDFRVLFVIGLVIVGLTWVALIVATVRNIRAG